MYHIKKMVLLFFIAQSYYILVAMSPLEQAAKMGNRYMIADCLNTPPSHINEQNPKNGNTPLHTAIQYKQQNAVQLLLDWGSVDLTIVNNEGKTAKDLVTPLFARSLRPYYRAIVCPSDDFNREPVQNQQDCARGLFYAAFEGNIKKVKKLLARKISPDGKYEGFTPLEVSVTRGNVEIVKCLLKNGANPNQMCTDGNPLLSMAAYNGYTEMVDVLLRHGAHPCIKDKHGYIPDYWAKKNNHQQVVMLLERQVLKEFTSLCDPKKCFGPYWKKK